MSYSNCNLCKYPLIISATYIRAKETQKRAEDLTDINTDSENEESLSKRRYCIFFCNGV